MGLLEPSSRSERHNSSHARQRGSKTPSGIQSRRDGTTQESVLCPPYGTDPLSLIPRAPALAKIVSPLRGCGIMSGIASNIVMSLMILSVLLLQQTPTTQQQQPQPTGSIVGIVVRIGTGEPIAGARVILARGVVGLPAAVGAFPIAPPPVSFSVSTGPVGSRQITPSSVPTDSQGRFVIQNVDAGAYRITVAANGYARQEYGQRSFGTQGTVIDVAPGQALKDIVIRMTPAGNVTGRISDDLGKPAIGAQVQLLRATYNPNGQKQFQAAGTARTNDRGEYRLFWVTPGRYYLTAGSAAGPTRPLEFGGAGDSPNGIQESYALTYYPGAADLKDAAALEVQAGVELSATDFTVPLQQLHKVRGRVIDSRTGQRPAAVNLSIASRNLTGGTFSSGASQAYNPADGTFELRDVAPGSYVVTAQIQEANQPQVPLLPAGPSRPSASAAVTVSTTDVDGLALNIVAPVSIPGRLFVEGQELSSVQGFDRMRVQLSQAEAILPFSQTPQFQALNSDGTFRADNALPGQYRLSVFQMPPDFYIKEARFDQTDVLNKPLAFTGSVPTPLDIVLSPKAGQIDGTVMNDKHEPTPNIQVVLIPDLHRERTDLYKSSTSAQGGRFTMRGITPGDYKLFAWEALEQFAYFDSDLVQRYEPQAKPVHVTESGKLTVEVSVIPATTQ